MGLDKLQASEPCESREASVKKKGNTGKNCKFTDEELSVQLIFSVLLFLIFMVFFQ